MWRIVLRVGVGAVFAYAGWMKAWGPAALAAAIANYRLVGVGVAVPLAYYLPWLELVCGVVVVCGWRPLYRGALWLVAGMVTVFGAALGSALARGLDIECGCFGPGAGRSVGEELGLVAALAAAVMALLRCGGGPRRALPAAGGGSGGEGGGGDGGSTTGVACRN